MGSSGPRLPSTDKIHSETKDRGTSLALLCVAQAHPTPTFRYVRVKGRGQESEESCISWYWGELDSIPNEGNDAEIGFDSKGFAMTEFDEYFDFMISAYFTSIVYKHNTRLDSDKYHGSCNQGISLPNGTYA